MSNSEILDWDILSFNAASLPDGVDKRSFYEGRTNFTSYVVTGRPNFYVEEKILGYDSFGKVFGNIDEELKAVASLFVKYYDAELNEVYMIAPAFKQGSSIFSFHRYRFLMWQDDRFSEDALRILFQIKDHYPIWKINILSKAGRNFGILFVYKDGRVYFLNQDEDSKLIANIENLYSSSETTPHFAPLVLRGLEEFFSAKENTQRVLGGNSIASLPFELVSRVMSMFSMDDFKVYSRLDPRRFEEYRAQRDNAALQYIREVLNYHAPIKSVFSFLLGATCTYLSAMRHKVTWMDALSLNLDTIDSFYTSENSYKKNYIMKNVKDRSKSKIYKRAKNVMMIEYMGPLEYFKDAGEEYLYVYITDDGIVYDPYNKTAYDSSSGVEIPSAKEDLVQKFELEMKRRERSSRQA